jgi:hypothetical protein
MRWASFLSLHIQILKTLKKFNMDEIAMNTTKARQKVISAKGKSHLFQEMVEGDTRVPECLNICRLHCDQPAPMVSNHWLIVGGGCINMDGTLGTSILELT